MLPAAYYHPVYNIILCVLTWRLFSTYNQYNEKKLLQAKDESIFPAMAFSIFMIFFIGLRPISKKYFWDMGGLAEIWRYWDMGEYHFQLGYANKIYDNLRSYMATAGYPVETFFFIIAIIYFGSIYFACRKMFPKDTLLAVVVYLTAFSTFSYGTNGIKAGSACALFLVALAYHENWKLAFLFSLLSWGFHHSMIMVVTSFCVVYFYKNTNFYFLFWIFSFIIAVLHISWFQNFFANLSSDAEGYLDSDYHIKGFRLDFVLYSAVPVIIGYYIYYVKKIQVKGYTTLINLYLMTNSLWMLCMYASFTNRIAYLSWFLHPLAMIYPFYNEKIDNRQYQMGNYVMLGNLLFTLFTLTLNLNIC